MNTLLRHTRTTLRQLRRSPAFTLITVVTLAIGIGANAAIFSVVHAVLIRPLPYPEAERLVGVWHTAPGIGIDQFEQSDATYLLYRKHNRMFEDIGIYRSDAVNLTGGETPMELLATSVTASVFPILRVAPQLGRSFSEDEDRPGAEPVAVLSHALWSRRFGADPEILGRTIPIDGTAHTVVGVTPPGFHFPTPETRLWLPLEIDPANAKQDSFNFLGIARLRPGIAPADAAAELSALVKRLPEEFPQGAVTAGIIENARLGAVVHRLRDDVVGEVGSVLHILLGSVGVILLIACANVASLFLARTEGRRQEMAVRTALGAARGEVTRAFLIESILLALAGGALGLGLAAAVVRVFVALAPPHLPRLQEIGIDGSVLAFTLAISLVSGLAFGAMPALRGVPHPELALREGTRRASGGRVRHRARNFLVVAQLALALVLTTGSGLLVRSFWELRRVEPGFDGSKLLTLRLSLPAADYPGDAESVAFFAEALEKIRALPGVEAASAVSGLPLTAEGASRNGYAFEDFPLERDEVPPVIYTHCVAPDFFETLGIPLMAGRTYTNADLEQPTKAVIASAALAKRFWPGQNPVGKRLTGGIGPRDDRLWYTIVGVVDDVRYEGLQQPPSEMLYFPLLVETGASTDETYAPRSLSFAVRASVPPTTLLGPVRSAIWSIDSNLPVANVRTGREIVAAASAPTAFTMLLLLIAAGVAVVLGAVGLYGVVSYLVSQRTQEIGVRMALGADRGRMSRMVLRQGLGLALTGLALGLGGAFAVTRLLESVLFGVSPTDPLTFGSVSLLLMAIALAASYLPARRAAALDPLEALRYE